MKLKLPPYATIGSAISVTWGDGSPSGCITGTFPVEIVGIEGPKITVLFVDEDEESKYVLNLASGHCETCRCPILDITPASYKLDLPEGAASGTIVNVTWQDSAVGAGTWEGRIVRINGFRVSIAFVYTDRSEPETVGISLLTGLDEAGYKVTSIESRKPNPR